MNRSLKWILLAVIIFTVVVVIDQNLNGVEHPGGDADNIKMINLGAAILFIGIVITLLVRKSQKKKMTKEK
jgi:hypothetical protein